MIITTIFNTLIFIFYFCFCFKLYNTLESCIEEERRNTDKIIELLEKLAQNL